MRRCVEVYEQTWLHLHDHRPQALDATLLGLHRKFWETGRIYAEDGTLWCFEPTERPPRALTCLAEITGGIFNPSLTLLVRYHPLGGYSFERLKETVWKCTWPMCAAENYYDFEGYDDWEDAWRERILGAPNFGTLFGHLREWRGELESRI